MVFMHDLSPLIVSFGPFALRWYSLVYVLGFLTAYWLFLRVAKRGDIKGFTAKKAESLVTWLLLGMLVGARLTYAIVYNPSYYLAEPWKILFLWEGGMSFHGGFLGAMLAGWWYTKREGVPFWPLADLAVLPLSLFLVFGRLANFVNGELVGRIVAPSRFSWCIKYPDNPLIEGCRYPSQFFEAGKNLLVFLTLWLLFAKRALFSWLKDGALFWLFWILYGLGRFLTDFWRAPDRLHPRSDRADRRPVALAAHGAGRGRGFGVVVSARRHPQKEIDYY